MCYTPFLIGRFANIKLMTQHEREHGTKQTPVEGVSATETVIAFDPTKVEVTVTPIPQYTEKQLQNQKVFLADHHTELTGGDRLRQFGINAAIFTGATAVDLAESHLADKLIRDKVNKMKENVAKLDDAGIVALENVPTEITESKWYSQWAARNKDKELTIDMLKKDVKDAATSFQGKKLAAEFIEEWGTDSLYAWAANSYVQMATGVKGAKYVSETSALSLIGLSYGHRFSMETNSILRNSNIVNMAIIKQITLNS